jgi:peptidyl-prolyl cis-trans isomerase B (cyclophilin B)
VGAVTGGGALVAATAIILVTAGCGSSTGSSGGSSSAAVTTAASGSAVGADGCLAGAAPHATKPQYSTPPPPPFATDKARVVMRTSCGTITVTLDRTLGGVVTDAVAGLVANRFYNGLAFHRVVPDFVLQGGDPAGDGTGGPGFTVTQAPPAAYTYQLGDVAMAKTGAQPNGAAGSQFFIISGSQGEQLPPQYAVIGHAADAESLATIRRIAALAIQDGPPSHPVWIITATLTKP